MTRTENALLGALSAILFSISFLGLYDHYRDRPYVEPVPTGVEPREAFATAPTVEGLYRDLVPSYGRSDEVLSATVPFPVHLEPYHDAE